MRYHTLTLARRGPIASVSLANGAANRISRGLLQELASVCDAIADDDVRAVVLSAEGASFSEGWDAGIFEADIGDLARAFNPLAELPQPVIIALQGAVISAGLELALAGDVRIASDDAHFVLPETLYGLMPLGGGTARLPRLVGRGAALELVLTGCQIDAREAFRIGLVNRVVSKASLMAEAMAVAEQIVSRGPIAVRYAKEAVSRGLDLTLGQALHYETDLTVLLQTTEDRAEGVRAFMEKRAPRFRGR